MLLWKAATPTTPTRRTPMDRYIGIDVHTESCTFAIMGPTGKRLREQTVETNGKVLTDMLRSIAGKKHACIEEGTHAEWIYELLEPLVDEIVVTIPEKSRGNKSDSRDAWQRAEEMRRGTIDRPVFKAPHHFTALRAAVKAYIATQRDMVRTKTRLNSLYRSRGMHGMGSVIYDPEDRASWLARLPSAQRCYAELLSIQLDGLVQTHQRARDWMLEESRKVPVVRMIETAPGIGEIRAPLIVATVISPHRFRTRRQFWSYCGLAIVTRSSADWTKDRDGKWIRSTVAQTWGLNRNRQPLLKNVFKGAAEVVASHISHHPQPLRIAYERAIASGTKPNLAQLTLARRIAGAVLAMWKNKEKYDPARQQ
jgi:transposase